MLFNTIDLKSIDYIKIIMLHDLCVGFSLKGEIVHLML